jgi:hypothetical protein
MAITVGSLCTGYGGLEIGLRLAGLDFDTRWLAEIEPALNPLHGDRQRSVPATGGGGVGATCAVLAR